MIVLMVGATGQYASLVVPELKKRGATVRALVRDKKSEPAARDNGADETVIGDLEDLNSLRSAAAGADGVFHLNPAFAPRESEMGATMVQAAKERGVAKFVFSSVIHPSISKMTNHSAKIPVEEAVYESGMNFTVLKPAMFMQTLENSWPQVVQRGRFALPYSRQAKACYVDYRDVAEAAAIALTTDRLDYGTFELCAPGMVNRIELVAIMSEVLGRDIEADEVPFDEWAKMAQIPPGPLREGLNHMYAHYNHYGFLGGNALVLRAILDREPRSLKNYLEELAISEQKAA